MARKNSYRLPDNSFEVSNLHVKIIVIGYGCYGESSLILFMDGDVVFYSIAIDSYHYKEKRTNFNVLINKTADILDAYKVRRLDILCWTHPHDDHSKGIPRLISKYCDRETWVVFPMYLQNNQADVVQYGVVSECNLRFIFTKGRSRQARVTPVGVAEYGENNIDEFRIKDIYASNVIANVRVDSITPISSRLSKNVNYALFASANELSVSLVVDINGYGLFFGGDTINSHLEKAKDSKMKRCRFVKIPHHSSWSAIKLTNHLPSELDAICTTVFKWGSSNLPDKRVIQKYRHFNAPIYSTNNGLIAGVNYGILEYDYDFSQGLPIVSALLSGSGGKI